MSTTDIEALVGEGKKAALSAAHDDCLLLSDLVDALERQKAVVEALKPFADCADFIDTHSRYLTNESGLWTPYASTGEQPPCILVSHVRAARKALAALDAVPEGEG